MELIFEERRSDSPFVEVVWRTQSESPGTFTSTATTHWEMVVTRYQGKSSLTLRGPETAASPAEYPAGAEFFGIVFKLGTFMPHIPVSSLINQQDLTLPQLTNQSFWLINSAWQLPRYDNADVFINQLARDGLLAHEPVVDTVLREQPQELSERTLHRRFVRATGLTPGTLYQIRRARYAMTLLQRGASILDTVEDAGYFDQPHLTRSLKRYFGQTPAQVTPTSTPISILYETEALTLP